MDLARRIVRRAGIGLAIHSGWFRRRFSSQRGKLRILTYHGIVPDEFRDRPWTPSHYVTVSQFGQQMKTLAKLGPCPPLHEAMTRIREHQTTSPIICLTFDDGMADNVSLALPALKRYGHHATFFLATGHVDCPVPLFNDIVRLLRPAFHQGLLGADLDAVPRLVLEDPGRVKHLRFATLEAAFAGLWARFGHLADAEGVRALRTIDTEGVKKLLAAGMALGAHTTHHSILVREDRATRRREITDSVEFVRNLTGERDVLFAYPYGEKGDYDSVDLAVLESLGLPYAVTQQRGWNEASTPPLELCRSAIGLHCSPTAFLWEALGSGSIYRTPPAASVAAIGPAAAPLTESPLCP